MCPTCNLLCTPGFSQCPNCNSNIPGGAVPSVNRDLQIIAEADQQRALDDSLHKIISIYLHKDPQHRGPITEWRANMKCSTNTFKKWCRDWKPDGTRGTRRYTSMTDAFDNHEMFRQSAFSQKFPKDREFCQRWDYILSKSGYVVELTREYDDEVQRRVGIPNPAKCQEMEE